MQCSVNYSSIRVSVGNISPVFYTNRRLFIAHTVVPYNRKCSVGTQAGPAEVDNDWSGRTPGFYGRYSKKEAQKDYRVSSGVLLKIEVGIR